jgi:hypothetical protein
MRFQILFSVLALLLIGCKHSTDADMTSKLGGIWTMDTSNRDGSDFKIKLTISPDGHYMQHITGHTPQGRSITSDLEGTLQVKDGLLIFVTTKHSSPNAPLPMTNTARIVSLSNLELRIMLEKSAGSSSVSSNEVKVFQRNQ